ITRSRGLAFRDITKDLNLMTTTQIKTAVRMIGHHVFVAHGEVFELLVGVNINAMLSWREDVFQDAALDRPTVVGIGITQRPTGHVLTIEQRHEAFVGCKTFNDHKKTGQKGYKFRS